MLNRRSLFGALAVAPVAVAGDLKMGPIEVAPKRKTLMILVDARCIQGEQIEYMLDFLWNSGFNAQVIPYIPVNSEKDFEIFNLDDLKPSEFSSVERAIQNVLNPKGF